MWWRVDCTDCDSIVTYRLWLCDSIVTYRLWLCDDVLTALWLYYDMLTVTVWWSVECSVMMTWWKWRCNDVLKVRICWHVDCDRSGSRLFPPHGLEHEMVTKGQPNVRVQVMLPSGTPVVCIGFLSDLLSFLTRCRCIPFHCHRFCFTSTVSS